MNERSNRTRTNAEERFKKREVQLSNAQQALTDYKNSQEAVRANMARLREQWLTREAAESETAAPTTRKSGAKSR